MTSRRLSLAAIAAMIAASFAIALPAGAQGGAAGSPAGASAATAGAPAAAGAANGAAASGTAAANDPAAAAVRAAVDAWLKGRYKVDEVRRTPVAGIWEARIGTDLIYVDEKGQHAFVEGQLVELKTNRSLTQERIDQITAVKWEDLPLNLALKQVNGKGERKVAVFEDPNCPYCRNTRRDLAKIDNLTIYTFTYPILSADSDKKARQAWCAADKSKAWNELLLEGKAPANAGTCDTPVDKIVELGKKLRVTGTPTLIFANGKRIPGGVPAAQLQRLIEENSKPS